MTRRDWICSTSLGTIASAMTQAPALGVTPNPPDAPDPFVYCMNTSTLQGFKMPLRDELKLIAEVGYGAVEPWVREIEEVQSRGESVEDIGKLVRDLGLKLPSAIGFFDWVVDDDNQRKQGFENARRAMDLVKRIGGTRLAAPPVGATDRDDIDLRRIADRYAELVALGREIGVTPEVEVWGFSKTLGRLADAAFVAIASGEADACILPDVYHMYKGGTPHRGLRLLNGAHIPAIHMNDYPGEPDREAITDAHRVYPGDGIAPLGEILRDLRDIGFRGALSLELFNREYWKLDAPTVARTGLEKMKASVRTALGANRV